MCVPSQWSNIKDGTDVCLVECLCLRLFGGVSEDKWRRGGLLMLRHQLRDTREMRNQDNDADIADNADNNADNADNDADNEENYEREKSGVCKQVE